LAGLLDWGGDAPPASHEIEGRGVKERGFAHIKTITVNGGNILGKIHPCWNIPSEIDSTDSISTWGFGVIRVYGEKHFGQRAVQQAAGAKRP